MTDRPALPPWIRLTGDSRTRFQVDLAVLAAHYGVTRSEARALLAHVVTELGLDGRVRVV